MPVALKLSEMDMMESQERTQNRSEEQAEKVISRPPRRRYRKNLKRHAVRPSGHHPRPRASVPSLDSSSSEPPAHSAKPSRMPSRFHRAVAASAPGKTLLRGWARVADVWRRLADTTFGRALIAVAMFLHRLWKKRMRFSYACYVVVFVLIDTAMVLFIQWGVYEEPAYDDPDSVDETTKLMNSVAGQLTKFVSQIWLEHKYNALLNLAALGMIYLVLVLLINRFWVATAAFSIIMSVFAVANHIKLSLRGEPVLPSDVNFISSGNGGEIFSFIPETAYGLVYGTIKMLVCLTAVCLALQILDRRRCVIPFHWRRPFHNTKTIIGNVARVIAVIVSVSLLYSFAWTVSIPGTWGYNWARSWGDSPEPWNSTSDVQINGPAMFFLRLTHPKIMDKPEGYSQETMEALAEKYAVSAQSMNKSRANNLTDNTVIMILSESFSDPTRVSGMGFASDPMPNIRAIKDSTTSGLMLSPGYGGGTANIEYQALTGADIALFDNSMQYMYQELVPHQKQAYAFNQIWSARYGETGSVALHPYYKTMYLRDTNYKKFGFGAFYTLDSNPAIAHQDRIDDSPYVSDAASYQSVLDQLNGTVHPQFIQLVTMQNHTPHNSWYHNNEFYDGNTSGVGGWELDQTSTYAKGVNLTDQATADFLDQLNAVDKPVTVIFYGDHLPSIYTTASEDENNTLALHETDYFIWSNQASASAGTKLDASDTGIVSPNYFMALASEHMDAKVSPYLAFLSTVHADMPATERLLLDLHEGTVDGNVSAAYLNKNGDVVEDEDLSTKTKRLMEEYRLIQYDMTAGENYLANTDFFAVK